MATEVVQFYFCHCGTTAALPADDLAEYVIVRGVLYYNTEKYSMKRRNFNMSTNCQIFFKKLYVGLE